MRNRAHLALIGLAMGVGTSFIYAKPERPLAAPQADEREDYAFAACLARLDDPALREQGGRWAQILAGTGTLTAEAYGAIGAAVAAEVARTPIAQVKGDSAVDTPTRPAPLFTCRQISRLPAIIGAGG